MDQINIAMRYTLKLQSDTFPSFSSCCKWSDINFPRYGFLRLFSTHFTLVCIFCLLTLHANRLTSANRERDRKNCTYARNHTQQKEQAKENLQSQNNSIHKNNRFFFSLANDFLSLAGEWCFFYQHSR